MFPGITVTYVPFAVNTVDVALTEATSDGLSTSVTFPSTFLDTPLAFLDNAFLTSLISLTTVAPGSKVNVPDEVLSDTPPLTATSFVNPIG